MATATSIADELYCELDEPSDLSVSSIAFWLQRNIGRLNISLRTCFTIDDCSAVIDPVIDDNEKIIFKKMFVLHYIEKLTRKNLGAAADSAVVDVTSDGSRVRLVNKNEIAKNYGQLARDLRKDLDECVKAYRSGKVKPLQVAGDEPQEINQASKLQPNNLDFQRIP